ncbi:MAG TPA: hypothetical protein VFG00_12465, partial [Acidothermaceae bacterium]|nr:hypothetical protein [Acidothermaceae bacterium]
KGISVASLQDLTAHGVFAWLTFERDPTSPNNGPAAAEADVQLALEGVRSLHLPLSHGVPLYFALDAIVTSWSNVFAYYERVASLLAPTGYVTGAYCNSTVIANLIAQRVPVERYWQTGAGSPGGPVPQASLYQGAPQDKYGYPQFTAFGRTCDADAVLLPNFGGVNYSGLWTPPPPPPPPKPTPPPPPPPNPTPTPVDGDTVHLHPINISTDAHGDGFHLCVDLPWSTFVAVTHQGTTAASHFSAGEAHANQVNGHIALSVTGAAPNAVATVLLTATV